MTKSYSEDNFWAVLWEFLPGIIKFLSIVGVVAIVFNIFTVALGSSTDVRANSKVFDVDIQRDYNFTYGNADSKVKLLYFEDLQCPACKTNNPIMEEIEIEYKDRVNFVFKHYPLSQHIYAKSAAQAAQAAGRQGKFKEFVNKAFEIPDQSLTSSNLEGVARGLNLDIDKWNSDRFSSIVAKEVEADQTDINEAELPTSSVTGKAKAKNDLKDIGTPISVLYKDGKAIDWWTGGLPADQVKAILDKALN